MTSYNAAWPRREILKVLSAAGVVSATFGRALVAFAQDQPEVTVEMIQQAEWISGLKFTDDDRELMLRGMNEVLADYAELRSVELDNAVPPALWFSASPGESMEPIGEKRVEEEWPAFERPTSDEDVAYASLTELGALLRKRQISSVELTRIYLSRLQRFDPVLHAVITLTEELALEQAERADREIRGGRIRSPLHGIPWGAKDLLAVPGYRTTWGAKPYEDQVRSDKAAVAERLEQAGAVLVAKLSVGALAWGPVWFGGMTRNPWNTEQGSGGSSAGPAAATAAGLVGFSIGTETWASIISPCTRCGVTGLRPTFGRVSRHGTMALAWSMDKIGPIARSVRDCALVFEAIHGSDARDPSSVDRPFNWPFSADWRAVRVGYARRLFEEDRTENAEEEEKSRLSEWQEFDLRTLEALRELGVELVPIDFPDTYPISALQHILTVEAATAFDELTRTNRDDLLVRQIEDAWPNEFRKGQMMSAVEYVRANRIRTLVMREMEATLAEIDVCVAPSFVGDQLLRTNLTGHPAVVVPNGHRSDDGTPTSISFIGKPFGESELLAVAHSYQEATDYHSQRPPLRL